MLCGQDGVPADVLPVLQPLLAAGAGRGPGAAVAAAGAVPGGRGLRDHPLGRLPPNLRRDRRVQSAEPGDEGGAGPHGRLREQPAAALLLPAGAQTARAAVRGRLHPRGGRADQLRVHRAGQQGAQHAQRVGRRPSTTRRSTGGDGDWGRQDEDEDKAR